MYETKEKLLNLIQKEHWENGKSIRLIERENGFGKTTLNGRCKRFSIKVRSKGESIRASEAYHSRPKGVDHFAKKNPEKYKHLFKKSSERMKKNNPSYNKETLLKTAISNSNHMRKNPTFHEKGVFDFFKTHFDISFEFQKPINKYIIDFLFCNSIILEVDGRGHASRREKDAIRDEFLCNLGYTVMRVQQDSLFDKRKGRKWQLGKLIKVLKNYIPDMDISRIYPSLISGKYGVIVRKAYTNVITTY